MKIIDTHTHMNVSPLYENRAKVYSNALAAGVNKVINNGDSFDSFAVIDSLAVEFPGFCYSAIGIFPTEGTDDLKGDIDRLNFALDHTHNLVAVGEIGLDYHLDNSPETKKKQKALFLAQIRVAEERGLPIIVHSRDADADTLNVILDSKFKGNVTLHCYSGSFQMALRYLRHKDNVYFGIGGVLTFKNAKSLVEVVQRVPQEHFILETDAPFLTPMPFRGQRNEPAYITYTLDKLAELLGKDKEQLADEIYQRSLKIYSINE
jgi:TatD DNase family protein